MQEPSTYRLVFDIGREGYRYWWFSAAGLIGVAFGLLDFRAAKRSNKRPRRAVILVIAGLLWSTLIFSQTYSTYRSVTNALARGDYQIVEGRVDHFVAGDGRTPESFEVQGHRYAYSWSVVEIGYNRGGDIQSGSQVRITDVRGHIARLEVKP